MHTVAQMPDLGSREREHNECCGVGAGECMQQLPGELDASCIMHHACTRGTTRDQHELLVHRITASDVDESDTEHDRSKAHLCIAACSFRHATADDQSAIN